MCLCSIAGRQWFLDMEIDPQKYEKYFENEQIEMITV